MKVTNDQTNFWTYRYHREFLDIHHMVGMIRFSDTPVLITGLPGSGKSTLHAWLTELGLVSVELDQVGRFSNGRWLCDPNRIESSVEVIIGICDNLGDVVTELEVKDIVYIVPPYDRFTGVMELRARTEERFVEEWTRLAKITENEFHYMLDQQISEFKELIDNPGRLYLYTPSEDPDLALTPRYQSGGE